MQVMDAGCDDLMACAESACCPLPFADRARLRASPPLSWHPGSGAARFARLRRSCTAASHSYIRAQSRATRPPGSSETGVEYRRGGKIFFMAGCRRDGQARLRGSEGWRRSAHVRFAAPAPPEGGRGGRDQRRRLRSRETPAGPAAAQRVRRTWSGSRPSWRLGGSMSNRAVARATADCRSVCGSHGRLAISPAGTDIAAARAVPPERGGSVSTRIGPHPPCWDRCWGRGERADPGLHHRFAHRLCLRGVCAERSQRPPGLGPRARPCRPEHPAVAPQRPRSTRPGFTVTDADYAQLDALINNYFEMADAVPRRTSSPGDPSSFWFDLIDNPPSRAKLSRAAQALLELRSTGRKTERSFRPAWAPPRPSLARPPASGNRCSGLTKSPVRSKTWAARVATTLQPPVASHPVSGSGGTLGERGESRRPGRPASGLVLDNGLPVPLAEARPFGCSRSRSFSSSLALPSSCATSPPRLARTRPPTPRRDGFSMAGRQEPAARGHRRRFPGHQCDHLAARILATLVEPGGRRRCVRDHVG